MKMIACAFACAILGACGGPTRQPFQEERDPALTASTRVLFLGNSLTATLTTTGDDLPAVLSRFAASRGRVVSADKAIDLGHTLQESWDASIPQPFLALGGPYDFVVYQEFSTLALTNPDAFFKTALTTYQPPVQKALKPGAQVMLFENWALQAPAPFATRAQAVSALHAAYAQLSTALSTSNAIVPFASAWETVFASRPQSFLFLPDGKHPNSAGVYLNACLMYAMLFGESPVGMPVLFLSGPDAAFLQGIAAGFVPAAPSDAGVPDAGLPDAGVADAGGRDAGVPDAGILDAGMADAGVVDAGPADAGAVDAGAPDGAVPSPGSSGGASDAGNGADAGPIAVHLHAPPGAHPNTAGGCASGSGAGFFAFAVLLCMLRNDRRRARLQQRMG